MWVKIDDKLPRHPKILAAGEILNAGKAGDGAGLALAVYVAADCYCAEHLTDGLIAPAAIRALSVLVKRPHAIAEALVAVNLFEREGSNYRIHDYHDYNPSSTDVKERRKKDRERKGIRDDSAMIPTGIHNDSEPIPIPSRASAPARQQDGTGSVPGSGAFGISEGERERKLQPSRGSLLDSHANCASHSAGFCVHSTLYKKLVALCRGVDEPEAQRMVDSFLARVDADPRWKSIIPEADAFRFFSARWTEEHGGAKKAGPVSAPERPDDVWTRVLDHIELSLDRHTFSRWLAVTSLLSDDGDRLLVAVPNAAHADWLKRHHAVDLRQALEHVGRAGVALEFTVKARSKAS